MHPLKELFNTALKQRFPPIRFAFAYGSAVFKQHGRPKGKMLDLVLAVDDPYQWHEENLALNWKHYSFLKHFGPKVVTRVQNLSAGVYYNTLVRVDSQLIKYGVISTSDLYDDLMTWKWLYTSGRLHKPVVILNEVVSQEDAYNIYDALHYNLKSAVTCAVLLQDGKEFTAEDLFMAITGLSYRGDFRMWIGEDRNKVRNIVRPNVAEFEKLYQPFMGELVEMNHSGMMRKREGVTLEKYLESLPLCVCHQICNGKSLSSALSSIVQASSIKQSAKGILTAGIAKSLVYGAEKVSKLVGSIKRT